MRPRCGLGLGVALLMILSGCSDSKRGISYSKSATPAIQAKQAAEHSANTESYNRIVDNPFLSVAQNPLSTFAIDVDTAAYSNVRRFLLSQGHLPPKDAVRIEEMINYFHYDYPQPQAEHPIAMAVEVAQCPWNSAHRLVRIGLQGKRIDRKELPPRNLVFLIDVSGSMSPPNRLPLVKAGLKLLVEQLTARDRVAIVVYAGQSGLVLSSTPGNDKERILHALDRLEAGGSTNGGEGIQLAYRIAQEQFHAQAVNRVILATDGDFNVGISSPGELLRLIEEKRKSNIFLTVLGFGMGNLKDSTLEQLADHGNGHYAYIDSIAEARKVFVEEGAALVTIAKDVKVQVEFNPRYVAEHRLIGYENRLLHDREFNDDAKSAGAMGAGHTVTALYEIVPAGTKSDRDGEALRYQNPRQPSAAANSTELLTVKIRYKEPMEEVSKLMSQPVLDRGGNLAEATGDFRFAAAVAEFGLLLRDSPHKAQASYTQVRDLARSAFGFDPSGYRAELIRMIDAAESLAGKPAGLER